MTGVQDHKDMARRQLRDHGQPRLDALPRVLAVIGALASDAICVDRDQEPFGHRDTIRKARRRRMTVARKEHDEAVAPPELWFQPSWELPDPVERSLIIQKRRSDRLESEPFECGKHTAGIANRIVQGHPSPVSIDPDHRDALPSIDHRTGVARRNVR
jgi:hypothetical protein